MNSIIAKNEPSIFISHVFPNKAGKVEGVFLELFGSCVDKVDIITQKTTNGDDICRAYVHFKWWPNTPEASALREKLLNGDSIKVYYEKPWFWKCVASKFKDSNGSGNSAERSGPYIEVDDKQYERVCTPDDRRYERRPRDNTTEFRGHYRHQREPREFREHRDKREYRHCDTREIREPRQSYGPPRHHYQRNRDYHEERVFRRHPRIDVEREYRREVTEGRDTQEQTPKTSGARVMLPRQLKYKKTSEKTKKCEESSSDDDDDEMKVPVPPVLKRQTQVSMMSDDDYKVLMEKMESSALEDK